MHSLKPLSGSERLALQGMLGLTFNNESDYDLIQEDDIFNFLDLDVFSPGKPLIIEVVHSDSAKDLIVTNHTYNQSQIYLFLFHKI